MELGGRELMHGKDEDGTSQWAVLLDLDGAAFGITPVVPADAVPKTDGGASGHAAEHVGRIAGISLRVSGAEASRDVYREIVGWTVLDVEVEDADGTYTDHAMHGEDGRAAATIRHARGANSDWPPVWLIHLPVGDLTESLERVREGRGQVVQATERLDGPDAIAVVRDPVGACLALVAAD